MSWLYLAPLWVIAPVVIIVVAAALELGYRLSRAVPIEEKQVANVAAALLALVGLLLAFSYGMAGDRHAKRRATTVQETNSIGTFWLRTSLLPEPTRSEMRLRVRRYVDLHIEHRQAVVDEKRLEEVEANMWRLQKELWALLQADAERAPEAARLRLLVPALNAMIDDTASALAAKESRLPDSLLGFLFLLISIAGVVIGYRPLAEKRNLVFWALFVITMGAVMLTLLDMDRPRRGLITSDPRPYLRLQKSLQEN